jgi:hypothetical protein
VEIMSGIRIFAAVFAAAITMGALSTRDASARPAAFSELYYRCPAGYAFETSGSAVRCKKPAYTSKKPLANCTIGLYAATDRIGDKDMCAATNPISGEIGVERACVPTDLLAGYTKKIVDGLDYCGKVMPEDIKPPSVAIVM